MQRDRLSKVHYLLQILMLFVAYVNCNLTLVYGQTVSELDQTYNLSVSSGGYFTNSSGWGEKWILGRCIDGNHRVSSNPQQCWYLILPDGGLYRWNGGSNRLIIVQLNTSIYAAPTLLTDPNLSTDPSVIDQQYNLTYNSTGQGYVTNSMGWGEKWVGGDCLSNAHKRIGTSGQCWYYILPDGRFYSWNGGNSGDLLGQLNSDTYNDPYSLTNPSFSSSTSSGINPISPIASSPETISPNPTPFPTATPSTSMCEYTRLEAQLFDGYFFQSYYQAGDSNTPQCIIDAIENAILECTYTVDFSYGSYAWRLVNWLNYDVPSVSVADDCVAFRLFGARNGLDTVMDVQQLPWAYDSYNVRSIEGSNVRDRSSTLYIHQQADGTCTSVSSVPRGTRECYGGKYWWTTSPISLLLDSNMDIDADLQIAKFTMNPYKPDMPWTIWKASNRAPLLVYDPEHKGEINSAFQLFGDWTFGGKSVAKLANNLSMTDVNNSLNKPQPWSNGYEALATLDNNGDGKLSGRELEPLGLWFDGNRNGISEKGEVKLLDNVGITALYFKPNRETKPTNNLYADHGFERIVDGQLHYGASVDWRTDIAQSKGELVKKHLGYALGCSNNTSTTGFRTSPNGLDNSTLAKVTESKINQKANDLSGIWEWRTEESVDIPAEGYIGFKEMGDGKLSGHVYSTFGVQDKTVGFSHIFSAIQFEGQKIVGKDGSIKILFNIKPESTSIIENTITFDTKTQKLYGNSIAKVSVGTKPLDLKYSWVASKVNRK